MESILEGFTPDHIKIMLSLFLAVFSFLKLAEIKDQKTNLIKSYQVDVKDNPSKNHQTALTPKNMGASNEKESKLSQGPNVCGTYKNEKKANFSLKEENAQELVYQRSQPITLGQYLKRKHSQQMSAIQNDPLLNYVREFEFKIKGQHQMDIQQRQLNPLAPQKVESTNQDIFCYETPKVDRNFSLKDHSTQRTEETMKSYSKADNQFDNSYYISPSWKVGQKQQLQQCEEEQHGNGKKHTIKKKAKLGQKHWMHKTNGLYGPNCHYKAKSKYIGSNMNKKIQKK